jgi:hypothetical protein
MAENLLIRLELERDAAKRRSEKLIKLGAKFADHETKNECVNMASAEERVAKFMQELIDEEKAKAKRP